MSYLYEAQPKISTLNSTSTPLAGDATFTGTWEECWQFAAISIIGVADVAGTLYAQFSTDGSTISRNVQLSSGSTSDLGIHSLIPVTKYFRVVVINGPSAQSSVDVQSILLPSAKIAQPTSRLTQSLSDYSDVLNVRSGIVGKTEGGGVWTPVSVDGEGHLEVAVSSPVTAFGEINVAEQVPEVQMDFVYGENYRITSNAAANGTITTANNMIVVSTSANANSFAQVTSNRQLKYRAGQGAQARYTALFTQGEANSNSYAGLASTGLDSMLSFGYNGTDFGIWYVTENVRTHIAQTTWNVDRMDGAANTTNKSGVALDPTKGNVYKIQYQYLGFGAIIFSIENPTNGQFVPVHEIQYSNSYTKPSLSQPSMKMIWRVENSLNANNMVVKGASAAMFNEGVEKFLGPRNATNNNKTGITTETNIITLRNATTYNTKRNESIARIRNITFGGNASGGAAAGIATLRVIRNATLGGTPTWTQIDGTSGDDGVTVTGASSMSRDVAGTTVTGGTTLYNAIVAIGSSYLVDVTDMKLGILPGETMTFAVESTGTAIVGVGIVWNEDI